MQNAPFTYNLQHLLWSGVDLLFPPRCAGCGEPGWRWCPRCAEAVQHPVEPLCQVCGAALDSGKPSTGLCPDCERERPRFRALRSWSVYEGPIQRALQGLKYHRNMGFAEVLVPPILEALRGLQWPVDVLVPVPLGRKRMAERGYNQVNLIARPLSMVMRIPYAPEALRRCQETRSQVGLTRMERRQNVRNAFRADKRRVDGCVVLLMDDIATTGSTLSSCAEALYEAGARDVFAYTVSRAMPRHGLRNA